MEANSSKNLPSRELSVDLHKIEAQIDREIASKLNLRHQIARKLLPLVVTGILFLSACSPVSKPEAKTRQIVSPTPTVQVVETPTPQNYLDTPRVILEKDLLPYDVVIPSELNYDLTEVIWYGLTHGSAKNLDEKDFYHCHLLITREAYEEQYAPSAFKGTLSGYINNVLKDYQGLLCHAQELTSEGLNPKKRNLVIWRGGEPYITTLNNEPPYTVSPRDLGVVGIIDLTFYPQSEGEIKLPDGRELNVVVEYPEIYTIFTTPRNMKVDLP